MSDTALEKKVRRRLEKEGRVLQKVRADSRWYPQYGPYMVVDAATNVVVASGCELEDLDAL